MLQILYVMNVLVRTCLPITEAYNPPVSFLYHGLPIRRQLRRHHVGLNAVIKARKGRLSHACLPHSER